VAAQLSVIWQIIMLYKEEKVSEDVNQVMDNLDALLQKSYKKTAYNSENLKRLWVK
jgi:hypothetical protein